MCARRKSPIRMLLFGAAVSLLALSIAAKGVMTWAAYWNYPVRPSVASVSMRTSIDMRPRVGWLGVALTPAECCR